MIPKFRAWMPSLQWMCEVLAISWDDKYCDVCYLGDTERNTEMTVDFDEIELIQSTGLFDKNGREIFAGDIIEQEGVFAVIRLDNTFGIYFELENDEFDFPEVSVLEELEEGREQASIYFNVVGNIYENKELLEGTE